MTACCAGADHDKAHSAFHYVGRTHGGAFACPDSGTEHFGGRPINAYSNIFSDLHTDLDADPDALTFPKPHAHPHTDRC